VGKGIFGPMFDTMDDAAALEDAWHDGMAARNEAYAAVGGDPHAPGHEVRVAEGVERRRQERARARRRELSGLLIERFVDEWDDTKAYLRRRLFVPRDKGLPIGETYVLPSLRSLRERAERAAARLIGGAVQTQVDASVEKAVEKALRQFFSAAPGVYDGDADKPLGYKQN